MANMTRSQARKRKHLRVRSKISGTPEVPRLNVFKSNKNIEAQIVDDVNGKTLVFASTTKLNLKSNNKDNAAAVGKDLGAKAVAAGIKTVVFDRSGYIYHGKIKALADAVRAEGVKF